jgi:hypothetical protein
MTIALGSYIPLVMDEFFHSICSLKSLFGLGCSNGCSCGSAFLVQGIPNGNSLRM